MGIPNCAGPARPSPRNRLRLSAVIVAAVCGVTYWGMALSVRGGEMTSNASDAWQTLLLDNGQMLSGEVSADAVSYFVTTPHGDRVAVGRERVQCLASSEMDVYRHQAAQIEPADVDARVALTQWCLHHRLLDGARVELARLRVQAPKHPRIETLRARLEILKAPEDARDPSMLGKAPTEPERPHLPSLPHDSMAKFTGGVQPLLFNACAAAQCHGRLSNNRLRLQRPPPRMHVTQRLTERNLAAILAYVNFERAEDSGLWRMATVPHGGSDDAPLPASAMAGRATLLGWLEWIAGPAAAASSAAGGAAEQAGFFWDAPQADSKPVPSEGQDPPMGDPFDPSRFPE